MNRRGRLTRPRRAHQSRRPRYTQRRVSCPALPRPARARPAPRPPQRFEAVTLATLRRVDRIVDRLEAGQVKPADLATIERDEAGLVLIALRYASALDRIDPEIVDLIAERAFA